MGVIVYELLTLRKPFDGDNITSVFEMIKNKPLDPLPPNTSRELSELVHALLNKEKKDRPNIY